MPNAQLFGMRKPTDQGTNKVEGMSVTIGDPANPQELKTLISDTGGKFDVCGYCTVRCILSVSHSFIIGFELRV